MFTMHKTLVSDWLTYVQNIAQPSFGGGLFDVVGSMHLHTLPMPLSGPGTETVFKRCVISLLACDGEQSRTTTLRSS